MTLSGTSYKHYTITRNNLEISITTCKNIITRIELNQQTNQKTSGRENLKEQIQYDLHNYLDGEEVNFTGYTVDLSPLTPFQRRVLEETRKISYGEVITYGELARRLNTSPRATGGALSKNPIPIVIPCHRVVGASDPGGFSCGISVKKILLEIEGVL